jgi:HTH-type transcriptional regulator / antitoxin HigA
MPQRAIDFSPDWLSPPGDTIADILSERDVSETHFAEQIDQSLEYTTDLIKGRIAITIDLARRLESVLGASVEFWISRDYQYRNRIVQQSKPDQEWLSDLPVGDMIKFGWLNPRPSASEEMDACLRFFDVPSVAEWHQRYRTVEQNVAFRTSRSFESRPASVAAWLRQGDLQANSIACAPWNAESFQCSLVEIRRITRQKDPVRFLPALRDICAAHGVAMVIVRTPNGCRASGATRFLSEGKAVLQLSFRHLSDDHFWFSFFHEAGHLLLHGHLGLIIEGATTDSTAEEEANQFAQEILIPKEYQTEFRKLRPTSKEVIRFSHHIGVSPGIVVGQLQFSRRIGHNQLNRLKRRFSWAD